MQIKARHIDRLGRNIDFIYSEGDPYENLEGKVLKSVHAFCFYKEKLVLVKHPKSGYLPPGGGIESKETCEEAVVREVKEETNMKVLYQKIIGFQDAYEPEETIRQTRSFCLVEPYGDFVKDPDGEITEIVLIDPKEYKKYSNWGEIGDRIMTRALEMWDVEFGLKGKK